MTVAKKNVCSSTQQQTTKEYGHQKKEGLEKIYKKRIMLVDS